jgi:hypothetical protein
MNMQSLENQVPIVVANMPYHATFFLRYFTDLLRHLCVYLGHCSNVTKIAQSDTFKMMMLVGFVFSSKWHWNLPLSNSCLNE